ncbi:MAG: universal stress protein [Deltaproteobacteria bacterium]|nr:universal stress protein [Deltaproteobacteria bacterium]
MRIRKILFATDFSPASRKAFDAALDLAQQNKAELTIFHSIVPATLYSEADTAISLYAQIEADTRKNAENALSRLKTRSVGKKIKTRTQLRKGAAAVQILRAAKGHRVDVIVVGTQGRTGLSKLLLGSVASRVISMADRPVLTVPGR